MICFIWIHYYIFYIIFIQCLLKFTFELISIITSYFIYILIIKSALRPV